MTLSFPPKPTYSSVPFVQHHRYPTPSFSEVRNVNNASSFSKNVGKFVCQRLKSTPALVGTSRLFYHDESNPVTVVSGTVPVPAEAIANGYFEVADIVGQIILNSSQELVDLIFKRYNVCGTLQDGLAFPLVIKGNGAPNNIILSGTIIDNSPTIFANGNTNLLPNAGNNSTLWIKLISQDPPVVGAAIGWKLPNP